MSRADRKMLGQAIIAEKYKENMKDTLLILSKCNKNLAFKNSALTFRSRWGRTFQTPLKPDLDDFRTKCRVPSHMLPRGNWLSPGQLGGLVLLQWSVPVSQEAVPVELLTREPDPLGPEGLERAQEPAQTVPRASGAIAVACRVYWGSGPC